jgi:hypothetical protein
MVFRIFYTYDNCISMLSTKRKVAMIIESPSLTEEKFASTVAACFAEMRYTQSNDESCIIHLAEARRVARLVFGERPNSVGLFRADGCGLVLVELKPDDYECLKKFYDSFPWGATVKSPVFGLSPVRHSFPFVT